MATLDPSLPLTEQERFRALLDAFHEAVLIHDIETGAILDANARAAELFGYSLDKFNELTVDDISVGLEPCTLEWALKWMKKAAEGEPQHFEWLARTKKGRIFWTEMHFRLLVLDGKTRILASVRDITEAKQMISQNAVRIKRIEAQNSVFLGLAEAGYDFDKALRVLARYMAAEIGDLCILELWDSEGNLVPMAVDQPYLDGGSLLPEIKDLRAVPPVDTASSKVLSDGEPLRITDPSGNRPLELIRPEFHPFLRRYHAHSVLIVPMHSQGLAMGAITLAKGSASKEYSQEDLSLVMNLADRASLALANARLFAENIQQAEALMEVNQALEARVKERTQELAEANARLHLLAVEDSLTGLANRRRFDEVLAGEVRRMRRNYDVLSLLMCDVDFFKRYNDRFGHAGGDECLKMVGEVMRKVFRRAGELPARYGGEEFAVVLPGVTSDHARRVAEKLRASIEDRALPHPDSEAAQYVTLSIGVVTAKVTSESDATWFIEKADAALYRSKHEGRNRVTTVEHA